ncbi:phenylalanine--tRNA ligase subunit alpha, partial [Candidatus Woesearchaeota archaeon]|nr:phenylalanine--tRNA ligase subunit alpha [Candidatus Woesearchaeota archaeon]
PELKYAFDNLKKRRQMIKTVEEKDRTIYLEPLGRELIKADLSGEYADKLTSEDLKTGAWQKKEYRGYDVSINVPIKSPGKPHFVNEAIDYIKQVWLELGFQEMEGEYVQTAFWDLDALFVPQDHPAREMQDTFYLEKPAK